MEFNSIFTDKKGREIELDYDDFDTIAQHKGVEVGRLEFQEIECARCSSYPKLMSATVNEKYRRAGIGVAMMRYAVEMHGKYFEKPGFNSVGGCRVSASEYFTDEGAALIRRCICLGILNDDDSREIDGEVG